MSDLQWTRDRPTKPGFYGFWKPHAGWIDPEIDEVWDVAGVLWCAGTNGNTDQVQYKDGFWYGPIELPPIEDAIDRRIADLKKQSVKHWGNLVDQMGDTEKPLTD